MATPITATQMQKTLYESNRDYYNRKTWENLIAGTQQSAMAAENQLVKQYTDASTAAYTSYLQNRANIEASGIYGQSKQNMLSENRINLEEAYNTYRQNLAEQESSVATQYEKSMSNISSALETEAKNYAAYENLHYDYLNNLFTQHPEFYNDPRFAQYITQDPELDEETHEQMYDDAGNALYKGSRLKTIDELYKDMYTYNEETNTYDLTLDAVDYYDMIENLYLEDTDHLQSWQSYVTEQNPELAEWAWQEDAYNYTKAGTKVGTFKNITGRESTDFAWSYAERLTGAKVTQLQSQFDSFKDAYTDTVKDINNGSMATTAKENVLAIKDITNNISSMLNIYGIKDDFENAIGISLDSFVEQLANVAAGMQTDSDITYNLLVNNIGTWAAGGAGTGAILGSAIPGIGNAAGALVGAISGIITGAIAGSIEKKEALEQSKQTNEQVRKSFDNLLIAVSNYVAEKNTASAIDKSKRLY